MFVAAAGTNSGIYKFLLVLHILCAIVGFGGVMLNGIYAAQAKKRQGSEGLAITEANAFVSTRAAELFIYAVFILGMALVGLSDKAWKFDQAWLSISMGLYIVGLGVAHAVLRPGAKRIIALQREVVAAGPGGGGGGSQSGPPPQVAEIESINQRLAIAGAVANVLVIVILFMMVWKPGA